MFVVFDLDGTLALNDHRLHHIRKTPKDYDAFYAACVDDLPNRPVIATLLAHHEAGHRIEVWSGRSDQVEAETRAWLRMHIRSSGGCPVAEEGLTRMRPAGDHQPDVNLKRAWLRDARRNGGGPDAVYDDRDSVVAMWREEGVACFQVAPGAF